MPAVTSSPTINENEASTSKSGFEPHDSSVVDNEVLYTAPCSWVLSHVLRKKTEYLWNMVLNVAYYVPLSCGKK